jgi:MFS family permease
VGQAVIGLTFLVTGILIVGDWITIPLLVGSMFMLGVVFAFIGPARQAWLGDLLPREAMPNGVALQQISMTGTRIIGPLSAGILVGIVVIGSGGTYIFMGSLFVFVIATTLMLPKTKARVDPVKKSVMGDMKLGFSHVTDRPRLFLLVMTFIAVVLMGFSWQVLLPGLLENELGRSSKDVGWLMTSSAIAGLAVTLGMAGFAGSRHAFRLMLGSAVMLGISLAFLAWAPNYVAALIVMLGVGAGGGVFQMLNNSLVMQECEPQFFGRVMSLTMMAWGFNGLAGLPFGILADGLGERQTLAIMGVLVLVVTVIVGFLHMLVGRRAAAQPVLAPRLAGGK